MASFQNIVYQMILSVLRDSKMTSASPGKTNTFIGLETAFSGTIGTDAELQEAILELVGDKFDLESPDDLAQDLLDAEGKKKTKKSRLEIQASSQTRKTIGALGSPAGIFTSAIPFLPHAALVSLSLMLAPFIFDQLTKPGGPLDLRFKRIISDEVNAFLSRQTQKDTEMGVRPVIIQSKTGFTATNGVNNYNTLRGIREGGIDKERLDRIGMVDHTKGVFDFG